MVDAQDFWERKILNWEQNRYQTTSGSSLLERVAGKASDSLRFRLDCGLRMVAPHCEGKRIVELGCGSGLLAENLIQAGAASYRGIDFAAGAIERAKQRVAAAGLDDNIAFEAADVGSLGPLNADIVFSLGLLDWFTLDQIKHVYEISGPADSLHAFSEFRQTPSQWLHRLYVTVSYGYKTGAYRPRYYKVAELEPLIAAAGGKPVRVLRDRRLSFGMILTSLSGDLPPQA